MNFFTEHWFQFRPYLLKFAVDFSVSVSLYLGLYLFRALTRLLPVVGWAGRFIENLHSAGMVAAFTIFAILSVNDIIQIATRSEEGDVSDAEYSDLDEDYEKWRVRG